MYITRIHCFTQPYSDPRAVKVPRGKASPSERQSVKGNYYLSFRRFRPQRTRCSIVCGKYSAALSLEGTPTSLPGVNKYRSRSIWRRRESYSSRLVHVSLTIAATTTSISEFFRNAALEIDEARNDTSRGDMTERILRTPRSSALQKPLMT